MVHFKISTHRGSEDFSKGLVTSPAKMKVVLFETLGNEATSRQSRDSDEITVKVVIHSLSY